MTQAERRADAGEPDVPRGAQWSVEHVSLDHPDAVALIAEVQQEYVTRYGGRDDAPMGAEEFVLPEGAFFVGRLRGKAVATGAWRRSAVAALGSTATVEVKRMYVVPSARRQGLSRRILTHLEQSAAATGAEVVVLETGIRQPEAIALYESMGYVPIPGFGHYRESPLSRCFAKRVAVTGTQARLP